MINSSPVPPHALQLQSFSGEITTSSLRGLATKQSYRFSEGPSISPTAATSTVETWRPLPANSRNQPSGSRPPAGPRALPSGCFLT